MESISDEHFELIERPLRECQAVYDVIVARIDRGLGDIFPNPDAARKAVRALVQLRGTQATIDILNDDGVLGRAWYFGRTTSSIFVRGSAERVATALWDVSEALRERQLLAERITDLRVARITALNRAERERSDDGNLFTRRPGRLRGRE